MFYYYHVGAVFIALEVFFCQLDAFCVSLVAFYDIAGRIVCVADCVFHVHLSNVANAASVATDVCAEMCSLVWAWRCRVAGVMWRLR